MAFFCLLYFHAMTGRYLSFLTFSSQEIALFWVAVLLLAGTVFSLIFFAVGKLVFQNKSKKLTLKTAALIGFVAAVVTLLCFLVFPAMISDSRWESRQQACAEEAGYDSPADNNDPALITPMSQAIYSNCLDR